MDYPRKNTSGPRPPIALAVVKKRLLSFFDESEISDVNLLSKQDLYRCSLKPVVCLGVYSPDESESKDFAAAKTAKLKPASVGDVFGPSWSTHWFRVELQIPEEQQCSEVVEFHFDCEGEGFVYDESGTPLQGLTGGPVDRRIEFIIPREWRSSTCTIKFYIEVGMNGMFGNGLDLPSAPPKLDRKFELRMADLVVPNMAARRLLWDVQVIKDAIDNLPEHSYAGQDAISAASDLMDAFADGDHDSIAKARTCARRFLGDDIDDVKVYSDPSYTVTGIGHCHIDTAWLWTYGETRRKIGRSWSAQCDLLDRYPEHRMCVSQAQQFKWLQEDYPSLWCRIEQHIKRGVFQPIGGSWTEMDTNLPSGESLIRQFLYGQQFFLDKFCSRSRTFWLPDTFGYSPQIPQIARSCGIDNFFTQKLSWNSMNTFPRTTFNWVGLDGSQLLTHMAPCENYCSRADFTDLLNSVTKHKDLRFSKSALIPYGFGDGGGGPTSHQLEKFRRLRGLANRNPGVIPKHTIGPSVDDFFDGIRNETNNGESLDSFYGELYLEFHRGTYTTEASVKRNNRICERRLHDLELLATLATTTGSKIRYPAERLTKVWHDVLLNQFHDVLPGSSIERVYDDVRDMYRLNLDEIQDMLHETLYSMSIQCAKNDCSLGEASAALNTMPWDRYEVLSTGPTADSCFSSHELGIAQVPAYGIGRPLLRSHKIPEADVVIVKQLGPNSFELKNSLLSITVDGHMITSFIDIVANKELVSEGKPLNRLLLFDDRPPGADAWDVETYHLHCPKPLENGSAEVITDSPFRSSIAVSTKISEASWIKSTISLNCANPSYPENNLVEIECEVDWHENRKFLKAEFPVRCYSTRATYETQFGVVERPTHFNTSWDAAKFEVCTHKFADLSESDYGVSILNDCKYGFSTHASTMRLSLLRSTKAPDGAADMGCHQFRYAILPHSGNFQASSVTITRAAYNFNNPMRVLSATDDAIDRFNDASRQLICISGSDTIIIDTIKRSEDGTSIIARLYESSGGHAAVEVSTGLNPVAISLANGLEDRVKPLTPTRTGDATTVSLLFVPFEIITVRFDLKE